MSVANLTGSFNYEVISDHAYLTSAKGISTNTAHRINTEPWNVNPSVAWYTLLNNTAPTSCITALTIL